ncbi:MAG: flippase-like domain-containing protein [Bacilli bacterium]|nr:flippase-like domain-containing protein [Bacilli bacterium]
MAEKNAKKKNGTIKYIFYILIVLVATGVSLAISLWGDNFNNVLSAFSKADWRYILIMFSVVGGSYVVDGTIIFIFCRLYTRQYKFHQGIATTFVGQFYSDVTPGASGGQVMQVYTLKSQGIQVSNAASIMVMWFILYQTALILFDVVAYAVEWNQIMSIKNIDIAMNDGSTLTLPMLPLIIAGFLLNLSVIALLFVMSYSHHIHNFILRYVIGFLGKIHIIKRPDKTRENLRVQVENFKIELRRLQANVPVVILQIIMFLLLIFMRNCIPYLAGLSLTAFGEGAQFNVKLLFDAAFLSSFHQMVTGLIPIPGAAGVSELFYYYLFFNFFEGKTDIISATQILWRFATFHLMLVVSGFVAALYRSRGLRENVGYVNRQTFVDLQLATFDERKRSADTMYETRQMSRKELRRKLIETTSFLRPKKDKNDEGVQLNFSLPSDEMPEKSMTETSMHARIKVDEKQQKPKKEKRVKKKKKSEDSGWENWDL